MSLLSFGVSFGAQVWDLTQLVDADLTPPWRLPSQVPREPGCDGDGVRRGVSRRSRRSAFSDPPQRWLIGRSAEHWMVIPPQCHVGTAIPSPCWPRVTRRPGQVLKTKQCLVVEHDVQFCMPPFNSITGERPIWNSLQGHAKPKGVSLIFILLRGAPLTRLAAPSMAQNAEPVDDCTHDPAAWIVLFSLPIFTELNKH